ncbi:NAD(P)H-quinone oxidoreductase [Yersinia ruckeri]|uniref:Quinone oxidoreductase n=1 Tax=Yersinia ruckeri TaxID=29486 RepID=A0A085U941_YERRU|nr:NAD(P)H-quinone oxidoreductase [Yersinia ruckeri]ARZ00565.1 zinc-binding dehydrogenase [Yersinia ruckeri]AUQ42688.1 zinc-binding dehydrogenase [Yersinia ruckeri]EEP97790.1 NADPH:quinone reductase and Zn-dependent oxidoreductase [Yersinia ruckeri ATCC 29473]KFE39704.1 zinc-binding dehydrogenase [Yersinia ruckeri]KGA51088.1 NAD(P)H quinone oxidoreductase, PIG3 family protein [Yersinia ruckeri ATCC 29473]
MSPTISHPDKMTAIEITQFGPPSVLKACRRTVPEPIDGQILVKVMAAGVNRPDVMQRLGQYAPPKGASDIPGLEISGEVIALGNNAKRYKIGDKVCGLIAGGGYAEYCVIHETNALPIPHGLSMIEAAALPETFFTVWANLFQRAHLVAGETVLIHGGSSGIGTTSILLSKAFGAAKVIVTVGSEEKRQACLALGADVAINYRTQDFVTETMQATDGHGADVIVDLIAGDYVARNYEAAAINGRITQIGIQNGPAKNLNLMPMLLKRLTHTGSTLRSRTVVEKALITNELKQKVWPLFECGRLKPQIFATFPLQQAADAHELMEGSTHIGKIVLTV